MHFIDTHTHMYASQFDSDRSESIEKAIADGVKHMYLPNIDSNSIEGMKKLTQQFPENCFAMMGLHPCSVKENVEEELQRIEEELENHSFIAVGEIGMDLYWDKTFIKEQEMAFREQIQWAKNKNLPIVIHCREAFDEILTIMDEVNDNDMRGIFHCFTGTIEQAKHILNYGGFKLGIGGVLTFKNSGLDKVVKHLELKDLVLETDSPYLAPVPFRGKRNESAYLIHVAEKMAEIFDTSLKEVAKVTTAAAQEVFKI